MKNFSKNRIAFVILGAALVAGASATETFYTNRSTWLTNVSVTASDDFEGIAAASGSVNKGTSFSLAAATYSCPSGGILYVIGDTFGGGAYDWGSGAILSGQGAPSSRDLTVTFSTPTKAAGLDVMSSRGHLGTLKINLSDGTSVNVVGFDKPQSSFFGFTGDELITSIDVHSDDMTEVPNIDNVDLATINAVPEPSCLVLLGIATIGGLGRRKR